MAREHRISLNEHDFTALVNGEIINKNSLHGDAVLISLQDIGFHTISNIIIKAQLQRIEKRRNIPK